MFSTLDILPFEVKKFEIFTKLDPISRILLRNALLSAPLPESLTKDQHDNIVRNGLNIVLFFKDKLNMILVAGCAEKIADLDILKWLYYSFPTFPCPYNVGEEAAYYGHLNILQWAYSVGWLGDWEYIASRAAYRGHLEILKWLKDIPTFKEFSYSAYRASVTGKNEKVTQWLIENGCPTDPYLSFKMVWFEEGQTPECHKVGPMKRTVYTTTSNTTKEKSSTDINEIHVLQSNFLNKYKNPSTTSDFLNKYKKSSTTSNFLNKYKKQPANKNIAYPKYAAKHR